MGTRIEDTITAASSVNQARNQAKCSFLSFRVNGTQLMSASRKDSRFGDASTREFPRSFKVAQSTSDVVWEKLGVLDKKNPQRHTPPWVSKGHESVYNLRLLYTSFLWASLLRAQIRCWPTSSTSVDVKIQQKRRNLGKHHRQSFVEPLLRSFQLKDASPRSQMMPLHGRRTILSLRWWWGLNIRFCLILSWMLIRLYYFRKVGSSIKLFRSFFLSNTRKRGCTQI